MAKKVLDSNRRTHAAKVLAEESKKNLEVEAISEPVKMKKKNEYSALKTQFDLIKQDVFKLRADLARGYDLIKDLVETKISRRTLS